MFSFIFLAAAFTSTPSFTLTITKEYLSMLENGDRNPSDSLKEKMAKLYNCNIADIFLAINSTKCLNNKQKEAK